MAPAIEHDHSLGMAPLLTRISHKGITSNMWWGRLHKDECRSVWTPTNASPPKTHQGRHARRGRLQKNTQGDSPIKQTVAN